MIMDQQMLIIGGVVMAALMLTLTTVIVLQQRRIQRYSTPKYGFLGKPLVAAIISVFMGAGLIGGLYLVSQRERVDFEARADLDIQLEVLQERISVNGNQATYKFTLQPKLDGQLYGTEPGAIWNAYWNFNPAGSTLPSASESEIGLNAANPSGIEVTLERGTYTLLVTVDYRGQKTQIETLKKDIVI
jgi:hypothetical protein